MYSTPTTTTARSTGSIIGIATLCAVAVAGIVMSLALAFGAHHSTSASPAPAHQAAHHAVINGGGGSGSGSTPGQHGTASHGGDTPVASAAVASLQRQLGQLNFYEGPVDGIMTPQTHQAIGDLQAAAHLTQTDTLTPATQQALQHFLATGDNQMAG